MLQKKQDRETLTLIEEATHIAEKLKIKKILVVCESLAVWKAVLPVYTKNQFIIVIPSKDLLKTLPLKHSFATSIVLPEATDYNTCCAQ
jgi:hypothetical protein